MLLLNFCSSLYSAAIPELFSFLGIGAKQSLPYLNIYSCYVYQYFINKQVRNFIFNNYANIFTKLLMLLILCHKCFAVKILPIDFNYLESCLDVNLACSISTKLSLFAQSFLTKEERCIRN